MSGPFSYVACRESSWANQKWAQIKVGLMGFVHFSPWPEWTWPVSHLYLKEYIETDQLCPIRQILEGICLKKLGDRSEA